MTPPHDRDLVWRRQLVYWHALFGLLLLAAALILLQHGFRAEVLPALACILGIGAAYAVWGARALVAAERRLAVPYLVVAWLLFLAIIAVRPQGDYFFLAFGLFPQTWALLPQRAATAVVVGVVVGMLLLRLVTGRDAGVELQDLLLGSLITLTVSVALGLLINRLVQEMETRADTIDELHETQAALGEATRAEGVAAERERLSREIHDTLAQGFTSIVALSRAASAAADRSDLDAVRDRLRLVEETAADNLIEARRLVAALTPGHLVSSTLPEALRRVVASTVEATGMVGDLVVDGEPVAAATNSEVVLLRTVQEALANTRKHSGADSFTVRLSYSDPVRVSVTVTDDGVGFDPDAPRTGFGLNGATARAADLGSVLTIDSEPGSGTRVHLEVPR